MKTGVLLMAHGSPESVDRMGDYLRHVLTRKPPTPEIIRDFQERYSLIGGRSPLLEISQRQARALQERLGIPVYVGMRHWNPFIRDVVEQARQDGIDRLIGLPLAPQYSQVSVGAYHAELAKAGIDHVAISSWHLEPSLLEYWRGVTAGKDFVLFTAHSIPTEGAEPYPTQLREMVTAIARGQHAFAYQSKSPSPIPWLGPDVPEVLVSLPRTEIAVAAIGFICDHVEVLYDLDILHRDQAESIGLRWNRLPMPNDHPLLIEALASAARKVL